jgi:hypothetical protein
MPIKVKLQMQFTRHLQPSNKGGNADTKPQHRVRREQCRTPMPHPGGTHRRAFDPVKVSLDAVAIIDFYAAVTSLPRRLFFELKLGTHRGPEDWRLPKARLCSREPCASSSQCHLNPWASPRPS